MSATPAQPFSASSVIDEALATYKDNLGILLPAALGLYLINFILAIIFFGSATGSLIIAIVALILGSLFTAFVIELARDARDGKVDSSIGQLFAAVTPVLAPLIGASILVGFAVGLGLFLFIVPGLWLMTIWACVIPIVVLERIGVFASFGRSRDLVRGDGWQVFFVIVFIVLLGLAVSIIGAIVGSVGDSHVFRAFINWIFSSLVAPATSLASAVLYLQLREAKGGGPIDTGVASPSGVGGFTPPPAPAYGTPPPPAPDYGTPPPPPAAPDYGTPPPPPQMPPAPAQDAPPPPPQMPPAPPAQDAPPPPPQMPPGIPGTDDPPQIPGSGSSS